MRDSGRSQWMGGAASRSKRCGSLDSAFDWGSQAHRAAQRHCQTAPGEVKKFTDFGAVVPMLLATEEAA